jgi:multidrug efflux pump subunit AcrB
MNITEFAIKNNVLTLSLLVVLVTSGISTFQNMPRDDMPPFLVRVASVVTVFPGASPERMELLISNKIEEVCQEVPEVDYIQSENRVGVSVVTIVIKDSERDLQPIFDKLRRKVEALRDQLPSGVVSSSFKDEGLADVYGIILGLTVDGFSYAELKKAADTIRDDLIKLPNAAKVSIVGTRDERIYLDYDNARLASLGLTQQKLKNIIASTNIVFSGGDVEVGDERIILEPTGNFDHLEDIAQIIVSSEKGELVFLGDIVNIYRGYVEPKKSSVRIDGKPGLAIGINLKKGGNIIELGREIDARLEYYQTIFPWGFQIVRVASQDVVVGDSVDNFLGNLYQAVGVVFLVMLVFLGLRTGLIVASLIPMAIVTTILLMSQFGLGLNQVSLASLIIALGMLVDNAIVVSESVMVKMENGQKAIDAAITSAKELFMPLLISSLTASAAFLAFYLAESVMGEIMGELFVVVSFALLSSWLLSMTLIPLLCIYFLKVRPQVERASSNRMKAMYEKILLYNLHRPFRFLAGVLAVFILALWVVRFLPFIFFPDSERALVTVTVDLPLGSTIDKTEAVVKAIENYVIEDLLVGEDRVEGVVSFSSYTGEGAPKYDLGYTAPEALPSSAHILLNTSSSGVNQRVIDAVDNFIFQNLPEARARVKRLSGGGGGDNAIEIRISGDDPEVLYRLVAETKAKLQSIEGSKNIRDNWGPRTKKFIVDIDQHRARLAGVTSQDIAVSLQTALNGLETGQFREVDQIIPIVMRNNQMEDRRVQDLESMQVYVQQSGKNVPLKQVADMNIEWQAAKILRRDLTRTISVTCGLKSGYTAAEIMEHMAPWLEQQEMPSGYAYKFGGEAEQSAKNIGAIMNYLPLSFFIIVLLLISQFNSLRKPLIILLTIPLGLIGVIFGLLLSGSYFGFMPFLGIISLAGIVINNAIVLIDRIQIEMNEFKRTPGDAIVAAAQQRFRPIMLTTATTTLGLIPLWIGGGVIWEPMAITIIFGLLFATILTLLVVPVMYRLFFRVSVP